MLFFPPLHLNASRLFRWLLVNLLTHKYTHIHAHTDAHLVGSAKARLRALLSLFTSPAHFRFSVNLALFLNIMKLSQSPHRGTGLWKNLEEPAKVTYLVSETFTGLCESDRTQLLCTSGGLVMTSKRKLARLNLRRSLSEQLRSSTSKAWDLLWKNVKERRLAGQ